MRFVLILICLSFAVWSNEQVIVLPIADPLPLTLRPEVGLDRSNQTLVAMRERAEPERNMRLFEQQRFPWHLLAAVATLGAMAIAAGYAIIQYWPRPGSQKTVDPKTEADGRLNTLESENLPAKGRYEEFYDRLTNIVRQYVEGRYGLNALEQSTPEVLANLSKQQLLDRKTKQTLADLLSYADQVKWAKMSSTPEKCKTALQYARDLVQQ